MFSLVSQTGWQLSAHYSVTAIGSYLTAGFGLYESFLDNLIIIAKPFKHSL